MFWRNRVTPVGFCKGLRFAIFVDHLNLAVQSTVVPVGPLCISKHVGLTITNIAQIQKDAMMKQQFSGKENPYRLWITRAVS